MIYFFVKLKFVWEATPFVWIMTMSASMAACKSLSTVPTYDILLPNRMFTYQFWPFYEMPLNLEPRGASSSCFLFGHDLITMSSGCLLLRPASISFLNLFCSWVNYFSVALCKLNYLDWLPWFNNVLSCISGFSSFNMNCFLTEFFVVFIRFLILKESRCWFRRSSMVIRLLWSFSKTERPLC